MLYLRSPGPLDSRFFRPSLLARSDDGVLKTEAVMERFWPEKGAPSLRDFAPPPTLSTV